MRFHDSSSHIFLEGLGCSERRWARSDRSAPPPEGPLGPLGASECETSDCEMHPLRAPSCCFRARFPLLRARFRPLARPKFIVCAQFERDFGLSYAMATPARAISTPARPKITVCAQISAISALFCPLVVFLFVSGCLFDFCFVCVCSFVSGSLWQHLGASRSIWESLGASGSIWESLAATACDCLRLPATACDCLRLPVTACDCLRLPATACDCLRRPATACDCLRLPATATQAIDNVFCWLFAAQASFFLFVLCCLPEGEPTSCHLVVAKLATSRAQNWGPKTVCILGPFEGPPQLMLAIK